VAIEFGLSRLRGYTNGWETGCAITTGGADGTAIVATGAIWIGGSLCQVTAANLDLSALSPKDTTLFIFGRLAAGQSSTATLDATSADPRVNGWAVIGNVVFTTGGGVNSISSLDTSGITGMLPFGRAMNCNVNLSYDQSIARGGTLIFGNDMKLYNGACEGTLEFASLSGFNLARILGASWASGGAVSGTLSLSATQTPLPFMVETQQITNNVTATVRILKCYSNQLAMNITREEFIIPTLSFQAIGNSEGNVITINV